MFGPAWTGSLPGPDAGAADARVDDHSATGYFTLISDYSTGTATAALRLNELSHVVQFDPVCW